MADSFADNDTLASIRSKLNANSTETNSNTIIVATLQDQVAALQGGGGATGNPPVAPTNARTGSTTTTTIQLLWDASVTSGVTGYEARRNGSLITTLGAVTAYTYTGLVADTTYALAVRAIGPSGQRSADLTLSAATIAGAVSGTVPQPTKVRAATLAAQPTIVRIYVNGSASAWEYSIDDVVVATKTSGYHEVTGLTQGVEVDVSVRAKEGANFSTPVTTVATPGVEDNGEATAGPQGTRPVTSITLSLSTTRPSTRMAASWGTGAAGFPSSYDTEIKVDDVVVDRVTATDGYYAGSGFQNLSPNTQYTVTLTNIDTATGDLRSASVSGSITTAASD